MCRHVVETDVPSTAPPRLQNQKKPSTTRDEPEPLPIPSDDDEEFQLQPFAIKFATTRTGSKPSMEGQVTILPLWDYDYIHAMLMKKAAEDLYFSMTMGYRIIRGREKSAVTRLRSAADLEDLKDQVKDLQEVYSGKNKNWSVSISLQAKYVPPISSGSSDGELDNPARIHGGRKRAKKRGNNPSKRMLSDVRQHAENNAFKRTVLSNVTRLQEKWVCEEHEGYCWKVPSSGKHMHLASHHLSRWGQFMALPHSSVDELAPPHTPTFEKFHRGTLHAAASSESYSTPTPTSRITPAISSTPDVPANTPIPTVFTAPVPPSSPLRMEDAEDVAGFMSFVAKNNPSYTGFNAAQTEQAFRENGLALEDLKRVPPGLTIPGIRPGDTLAAQRCLPLWKAPARGPTAVHGFRLMMF
ncbi:hypothetical protein G7K_6482-t1 [Saitoella complicata NRRL Y-17804]|uniref:Uncharacterized protein n=1 Tax=Saitoella complicata (strain BCRC 22490 / CBS 7301 / JCM 7358 / NBRC 10748 / NRRL Y-17804) TaxID=698492 RepID=A0A0E9NRC5_SAICN|nr:hypothetical protein G7K_6482-t1 [Saitoella complicata NRRL Y-17804]